MILRPWTFFESLEINLFFQIQFLRKMLVFLPDFKEWELNLTSLVCAAVLKLSSLSTNMAYPMFYYCNWVQHFSKFLVVNWEQVSLRNLFFFDRISFFKIRIWIFWILNEMQYHVLDELKLVVRITNLLILISLIFSQVKMKLMVWKEFCQILWVEQMEQNKSGLLKIS